MFNCKMASCNLNDTKLQKLYQAFVTTRLSTCEYFTMLSADYVHTLLIYKKNGQQRTLLAVHIFDEPWQKLCNI